jgi:hypothetical protein
MTATLRYGEVLEAVDNLELEEQQELVEVVRRRIAEHRRARIVAALEEARREFAAGNLKPQSVEDILRECSE